VARSTNSLAEAAQQIRTPLVNEFRNIAQEGDQAVQQSGNAADVAGFQQQKQKLEALTATFKQLSAAILPLAKQSILLKSYQENLARWESAVTSEYKVAIKSLLVRLGALALVLTVIVVLAEIWRRAIFRYVKEPRRRYQYLLIRRITFWFALIVTVAFSLAAEIGSLATFAGLITAGLAVALQGVLLAIVGYFFLIGKYGIRVGDRVQIAGVTGDIIEIGLIRLHMMEVSAPEAGTKPTGRIVAFSNAVVFQPGASFFKQIPGTNYAWREVTLTLAPETDYRTAEKRLRGAVESVFASYKERIEEQHREMQNSLSVAVSMPKPQSHLRVTQSGLEVVLRYPIELDNSAEIDDQVTRELLKAIEQSPKLRLVGSGTPNIQPLPEAPATAKSDPQPKPA
jgi:small-conductance mechanosensitive channel